MNEIKKSLLLNQVEGILEQVNLLKKDLEKLGIDVKVDVTLADMPNDPPLQRTVEHRKHSVVDIGKTLVENVIPDIMKFPGDEEFTRSKRDYQVTINRESLLVDCPNTECNSWCLIPIIYLAGVSGWMCEECKTEFVPLFRAGETRFKLLDLYK